MSTKQRWRAPREDGAILADPPLAQAGQLLAENRRRLNDARIDILGQPLPELRARARQETVQAAVEYFQTAGEPIPPIAPGSLVLAGHQPELFHPGVWVKNFALQGIARRHGSTPLNLVVDNDTAKSTGLRLPVRERGQPETSVGLVTEPFDRWAGEVPYEELQVQDEKLFAGFADRVRTILSCWDFQSLLPGFWEEVCRQAGRTPLLGERFAAARRWLERRWDCHNLELPLSTLCRTRSFGWFARHMLSRLADFHAIYNSTVRDYRQRFGIRSRNHPVPDLASDGDWLEVPLWGWRAGQTRRGRVFARLMGERFRLRIGMDELPPLDWAGLEQAGWKVRSRALTTTLFARLFLGDLFIHGIGGATYDALTDEIIRRFYGLEPPGFLMLSATLYLPLPAFPVQAEQYRELAHRLRDLEYNPQRHLSDGTAALVVQQKEQWIARSPATSAGRKERFRELRAINTRLQPLVAEQERTLGEELAHMEKHLAANAILQRRDYAFCLFPEERLRAFCGRFLRLEEC